MTKWNALLAIVSFLMAGSLQAQSLTKEQYEAFDLNRVSSISCPLESGGRMHFFTEDRGNTYGLAFSHNASKPRMIVKEAICRPIGRKWDLACKNRNGEKLFHVDVTGVYIHRKSSDSYDHNIIFSSGAGLKIDPRENLDSFTTERATLSKCKLSSF